MQRRNVLPVTADSNSSTNRNHYRGQTNLRVRKNKRKGQSYSGAISAKFFLRILLIVVPLAILYLTLGGGWQKVKNKRNNAPHYHKRGATIVADDQDGGDDLTDRAAPKYHKRDALIVPDDDNDTDDIDDRLPDKSPIKALHPHDAKNFDIQAKEAQKRKRDIQVSGRADGPGPEVTGMADGPGGPMHHALHFDNGDSHSNDHKGRSPVLSVANLPLHQYKSLMPALEGAELVALYFGASWCPDCKPITNMLVDTFSDRNFLLNAEDPNAAGSNGRRSPLAIVYVPSDDTEQDAISNGSPMWFRIPFNGEEKTLLKRHFHACANRETELLNVERKFGIPHLVILDGETHGILSISAVDDVKEKGYGAWNHWKDLQALARAAKQGTA